MGRDFAAELADVRCWDQEVQRLFEQHGEPLVDAILQNRDELVGLCEFIEARRIRSYVEIGTWTGRLVSTLHRLFDFELTAACDDGYAERFGLPRSLPPAARFFRGSSGSEEFEAFRAELGPVDLMLIDGDHSYRSVRRDYEIQRRHPHRFLAFHDITGANRHTVGVRRFWEEIDEGQKLEIVWPHRELGLDHSVMGIGIWSATEPL